MTALVQFKPHLIPCEIILDNQLIHLESADHQWRVTLPLECRTFLRWFDGRNTVEKIISKEFADQSKLSLKKFFLTLNRLNDENFFQASIPKGLLGSSTSSTQAIDEKRSFLAKPIQEWTLVNTLKLADRGFEKWAALFLLMNLALGLMGAYLLLNDSEMKYNSFLFHPVSGYRFSILRFFILCSLLLNFKFLIKSFVQLLGFGQLTSLNFRLFLVGVSVGASDFVLQKKACPFVKNLFYLSAPLSYLAFVQIVALTGLFPDELGDIKIIALFLTFVMLNPLRRSDFTELLERFLSPDRLKHFLPYLKGRALLAIFRRAKPIEGEGILVFFSSLAMLWIVCFTDFAAKIMSQELPNLLSVLRSSSAVESSKISAALILILLGWTLLSLIIDVLSLFSKHIYLPFFAIYHRLSAKFWSTSSSAFDQEKITNFIEKVWLFDGYSREWIAKLLERSQVESYRSGMNILIQHTKGNELYLLLSGEVAVVKLENSGFESVLARLQKASVFGEMALLSDVARTASVKTLSKVEVLKIPVSTFKELFSRETAAEKILDRIALGQYLATSKLFAKLPEESLVALSAEGEFLHFSKDSVLTQQGSTERDLYLIVRGQVQVLVDEILVGRLSQGNFFGEISLLTQNPRTATVVADVDSIVYKLSPEKFFKILARNPELGVEIEQIAEDRKEQLKWSNYS